MHTFKQSPVDRLVLIAALTLGLVFSVVVPRPAAAQNSGFGLGLVIGDPTGLSFKGYVGPSVAIDGGVGYGALNSGHLQAYVDFLWERQLTSWDRANMALYFGVGPKVGQFLNDDWHHHGKHDHDHNHGERLRVGARAPLGLVFQFTRVPVDVFTEVAAGLWFTEQIDFDLDLGVGVRYWF